MSSTNKTSHYNLPQFIGSDIPTWLGDFNSAMSAIDSGINAAATTASGAATTAAQAVIDAAAAQKSANDALIAANRCPFPLGYGGFFQTDPNMLYSGTTWEQKKDVFILASGDTYGAGSNGGEAQHTLTEAEMPSHRHSSDSYVRGYPDGNIGKDSFVTWVNNGTQETNNPTIQTAEAVRTSAAGGSQPHNNMPPYYTMPFWIRTA